MGARLGGLERSHPGRGHAGGSSGVVGAQMWRGTDWMAGPAVLTLPMGLCVAEHVVLTLPVGLDVAGHVVLTLSMGLSVAFLEFCGQGECRPEKPVCASGIRG